MTKTIPAREIYCCDGCGMELKKFAGYVRAIPETGHLLLPSSIPVESGPSLDLSEAGAELCGCCYRAIFEAIKAALEKRKGTWE